MSPLDWDLIETWQAREIPLHVVLRAIEDVFDAYDQKPKKRRAIKSLTYCKDEVEAQHEEWLEAQIGKSKSADNIGESGSRLSRNDSFSKAAIDEHFERILLEIAAAKSKFDAGSKVRLEKVEEKLGAIDRDDLGAEKLEMRLEDLDKIVDEILIESAQSARINFGLSKSMADYKPKMDSEAFDRTFRLMLLKQLREETGIPRFSLFYI